MHRKETTCLETIYAVLSYPRARRRLDGKTTHSWKLSLLHCQYDRMLITRYLLTLHNSAKLMQAISLSLMDFLDGLKPTQAYSSLSHAYIATRATPHRFNL